MAFIVAGLLSGIATADILTALVTAVVGVVTVLPGVRRNVGDDDDDFWTGLGKRMKRKLKNRLKAMAWAPTLASSPA